LLNKKASTVPPGCNGLMTVLDWLTNPWEPYKRGIMIGFDSSMDYAWIYRSILESVALTLKNNYDNMCNEMNHFAKHIIITGGGSNSDLFMQIFADVFNLPARRNAINGCASLGPDQHRGRIGSVSFLRGGHQKYGRVKDVFMPVAQNAMRYEALNKGIFRELTQYTDVILKKSYEVPTGIWKTLMDQSWSERVTATPGRKNPVSTLPGFFIRQYSDICASASTGASCGRCRCRYTGASRLLSD
jgi:sugar (pentulose or hexulose) kinase